MASPNECWKDRYETPQEARQAMSQIQQRKVRGRAPRRIYRCPECSGWHLTNREKPSRSGRT